MNFAKEKLEISTVGTTGIYASGECLAQAILLKEESSAFRQG